MPQRFTAVTSKLVPLPIPNVDTDQIIPAQYVNVSGRDALAKALFANRKAESPDFVLNKPQMRGRSIMLCGANFGCGSSREAAAWAMEAGGFRAMIGTTFNETFARNCVQSCLPTIRLAPDAFERLACGYEADPDLTVTIDLKAGRVAVDNSPFVFPTGIDPFTVELMVNGMDELSYLLERRDLIAAFEARQAGT